MATVRHVFMLDYVADMLGEHPDLIDAIVSNDDNLTYGSIISVGFGPDDYRTALTDDGVAELRDMIAAARQSPDEWDQFLEDFVDDPDVIKTVKAQTSG
ncbi:hypothetical protein [Sphingobium sp. BS19]|uniref:hypothetical protein n=1 Tax=Sphingobium sp. BS19 TaxID=3018973 RepID=UPI0022EEC59B|nr:hypothetical protein [Sphingobium sp. BS19]GLJ00573.1 hypothetical protein Sbs19_43910 [Sphingobium sp. BS19]